MAESTRPSAQVPPPPPSGLPKSSEWSPRPLQFSLRAMLIATTAFAVVAAVAHLAGGVDVVLTIAAMLLLILVPVVLGTGAVYSRGGRQTFFAGAFVGVVSAHFFVRMADFGSLGALVVYIGVSAVVGAASGGTAFYTRRFIESRGWDRPNDAP